MMSIWKEIFAKWGLAYFNRYYSIYQGIISDNEDPEFYGRVKIKCEKVYGAEVSDWAWPRGMFAGKDIGLFAIPNIGDAVWVSFEEGDPRFPVWEYGWFGKGDVKANVKNNGNKPTNYVFNSTAGHRIELDNKAGAEAVRIYSKDGFGFEINENGVSVITAAGKNIFIGSLNAAAEPAVLGDKNGDLWNDCAQALSGFMTKFTAAVTADAATATSLGLVGYAGLAAQLTTETQKAGGMSAQIPGTKSDKVKLD